jgi:hypothetical protein
MEQAELDFETLRSDKQPGVDSSKEAILKAIDYESKNFICRLLRQVAAERDELQDELDAIDELFPSGGPSRLECIQDVIERSREQELG